MSASSHSAPAPPQQPTPAPVPLPPQPAAAPVHKPTSPPLPPYTYRTHQASVYYCPDLSSAENALAHLLSTVHLFPGLGFDLEWRPNFQKGLSENPVALVQLATQSTVYLIHVSSIRSIPTSLAKVLGDSTIVKAGVGIQGDAKKLWEDHGIPLRGAVDLSLLARSVDNNRWKGRYKDPIGLARLTATYFNLELPKGKIQRSNWELHPLSPAQIEYAANDAHAGVLILNLLKDMRDAMMVPTREQCYMFDLEQGMLVYVDQGVGAPWKPENPAYDPGPPPPKPERKEGEPESKNAQKKAKRAERKANNMTELITLENGTVVKKLVAKDQRRGGPPPWRPGQRFGQGEAGQSAPEPSSHGGTGGSGSFRPSHPVQQGGSGQGPEGPRRRTPRNRRRKPHPSTSGNNPAGYHPASNSGIPHATS